MAEPRFNISKQRTDPFSFQKGYPKLLASTTVKVYDNYWFEDYNSPLNFMSEERIVEGPAPYFPWKFEKAEYEVTHQYKGSLPPGKYICHSNKIKNEYSPFSETNNLILEFAKVGNKPQINLDAIHKFVSEYGLLKEEETLYPSVDFKYGEYSVEAFHLYAREAYLVTKLYNALINEDHDRAIVFIKDFLAVPELRGTYEELGKWRYILSEFYESFSREIRDVIKEDYRDQIDPENFPLSIREVEIISDVSSISELDLGSPITDPYEIAFLEGQSKDSSNKHYFIKYLEGLSTETWNLLLEKASKRFKFDLCADLIATITNLRANTNAVFCAKPVSPEKISDNYEFQGTWSSSSLITSMWLLFYLIITNQLEVRSRICPFCKELIEEPRKNQIYHDKCRRGYNKRLKELVKKLHSEGLSEEEILKETDASKDQIKKWIV